MQKSWICLQLLFCISVVIAQEPNFYNTNQSLLTLNPSFAGSNGFVRNQFSYRNQWPNRAGNIVWYNNTFDAFIRPLNGGIGLSVSSEDHALNSYRNRSYGLSYAQHTYLPGNKIKIVPSVEWRYCISSMDVAALHYRDPLNIRLGQIWTNLGEIPDASKFYHDVRAGLLIHFAHTYVGGSVSHLTMPNVSHVEEEYRMPATINLHASTTFTFGTNCLIHGFVGYKQFLNLGSVNAQINTILFRYMMLGVGWWSVDTFTASAGFRGSGFTVGAGYALTASRLASTPNATWEIHASLNLRDKQTVNDLVPFEEM